MEFGNGDPLSMNMGRESLMGDSRLITFWVRVVVGSKGEFMNLVLPAQICAHIVRSFSRRKHPKTLSVLENFCL